MWRQNKIIVFMLWICLIGLKAFVNDNATGKCADYGGFSD